MKTNSQSIAAIVTLFALIFLSGCAKEPLTDKDHLVSLWEASSFSINGQEMIDFTIKEFTLDFQKPTGTKGEVIAKSTNISDESKEDLSSYVIDEVKKNIVITGGGDVLELNYELDGNTLILDGMNSFYDRYIINASK